MAATKNDSLLLFAIYCYAHCALCTASASEQIERKKKEKREKRKTHQLREFFVRRADDYQSATH